MFIKRKRIQNPQRYLSEFKEGNPVRVVVKIDDNIRHIAKDIGFSDEIILGESILPDSRISKAAFENSEGKCIVRKDLPMERAERYLEWTLKDWGGNYHSGYSYIPYYRYHREYLEPRAFEMSIAQNGNSDLYIVSQSVRNTKDEYEDIKLLVNLFLSIFHYCEIVNYDLTMPISYTKRLDWELLRPGKNTKEEINNSINRIIDNNIKSNKKNMYRRNIEYLRQKAPDVIAIGSKGFNGYIIFNYPELNIAVLESLMPNNATYILNDDWEQVSKMTKTEVLNHSLHKARVYHYENWEGKMKEYLENNN